MRFMLIISFGKTIIFSKLIISRVKIIKFPFKNFFFFIMRNLFQSEVNFTMEILKLMTEIFDGVSGAIRFRENNHVKDD